MKSVPVLFNNILHHWNIVVTYKTLSIFETKSSIECADALNSFNDDVLEQKIDELVDSVMWLDLPEFDEQILNVCKL